MSELFENFKKNIMINIIPLQSSIKKQANLFIDTFINDDTEDSYSDDFEQESINGSDADDEKECNSNSSNLFEVPKQYTFIESVYNTERIYSPVVCSGSFSNSCTNFNSNIDPHTNTESNTNLLQETIIDTKHDDKLLIENLIVLSQLEKYQKLSMVYDNTNNKLNFKIQIDNSYVPQFTRWYYNQNRTITINNIDNLIDYTIQQCVYYKNTNDKEYIKKYNDLLNNTVKGLLNLKITYESDTDSSLKISKIVDKINEFIN